MPSTAHFRRLWLSTDVALETLFIASINPNSANLVGNDLLTDIRSFFAQHLYAARAENYSRLLISVSQ